MREARVRRLVIIILVLYMYCVKPKKKAGFWASVWGVARG